MLEIGKILTYNSMYVATYVKVKFIGQIIWKLMADIGKGGLRAKVPCHYFVNVTPIHSKIQLSEGFVLTDTPRHGGFFCTPMYFSSSRRTYLGLPIWNASLNRSVLFCCCNTCLLQQTLSRSFCMNYFLSICQFQI